MANSRYNRFDKLRDKIDKRTPLNRKSKNNNSDENTFFAEVFPIIIVVSIIFCGIFFYFLFNNYKEVLVTPDSGFFINSDTLILGSKKTNNHSNNLEFVNVKENDVIYKNALNHYVDNSKEETVNIEYPLFIDKGLSFINYNENINLINHEFERSTGYSGLLISYGRVFDLYTRTQIDQEKYLLLSYEDDVMINLYDMKVKTYTDEYFIPVNSFVYFEENLISYYERTNTGFKYNVIKDVDFESLISFSYESALEYFEYDYEKFLKGIDTIYIKDFVIDDEIDPDDPIEEIIPPSDDEGGNGEIVKPEFVWQKPSVTISDITPSVYTLTGNIKIVDNAHVIVKEPTFTFYRNNKTFLRRTYYSSGEIKVTGLIPSTTFTMVGTYTYLAQDMETRIAVTFYSKEITTGPLDSLEPINLSFVNGQIYPKKVEVNDVKVDSDLESEAISGVSKISLNVGDKKFFLSNSQVVDIINGRETLIESPESLASSSKIDYEFKLVDREGNELKTTNNSGTTRTSKRHPNVSLRIKNSEIDSVTIGINVKNEDNIEFNNYMYIVKKSDGSIVKQESVTSDEIVLTNLDPDQLFNIVLYADYDIDDGNGLSNHQLASMDFTSKPITTLGYINLPMEIETASYDSVNVLCNINSRKTNTILVKLLQRLKFDVYDESGSTIVDSVIVEGEDIQSLKDGNKINVLFDYLDSFTKYKVVVTTVIQQGSTVYEIGTTQGLEEFMTNKLPAKVNITNPFTTETMIDFDISIEDIDHAIESDFVRLELRDKDQKIVNTKRISINGEPERITYNNLNTNEFYNIFVYADGYNETDSSANYKSKYLMYSKSIYTESGISGKIELISSLREPTGTNIADVRSEVKWLQMYNDKNIPKTVDSSGDLHIYSKDGSAGYVYDLSKYHGEIVTVSFKIKAIVPLNEAYKIYFTQYVSGSTSTSYSKELTGITQDDFKEYSFSFRVGSYSSLKDISTFDTDAAIFTPTYQNSIGQNNLDGAGFYLSNGTGIMSEYVVRDFEIHTQYDIEEYTPPEEIKLEQGSFSKLTTFDSPKIESDFLISSNMVFLEGKKRYSFDYEDNLDNVYDIRFYLFDKTGKYIKSYSWVNREYSFYVSNDTYVRIQFRYMNEGGYIRPDNIKNFKIYSYVRNEKTGNSEYKYELITKAKINLSDKRDEITNDDYFIKIYENGKEYKSYNYVELKDTLNLSNVIKNIELEEGKEYTVELGILIRDRYYALSTFEISTEDEVLGISTLGEWDKIQPYGHYILLNDLDFQNFTNRRIGVGYRYFHGVIDFQGYTMKQATAKTDGSSNTAYYRIYRIESDAVLKNLVLDIQLNNQNLNGSTYGFVHYNYGTIENVVLKITDTKETQMPQTLLGLLTYQNTLKGRIRNFVVKLENDLHYYGQSAVLVRENYGLIENGYVYGGDVIVDFPLVSGDNRQLGILTRYSGPRAIINHVFMDVTYKFPNNASYDKGGIMAYSNAGTIQNSYVIGDTNIELPDIGPIVQSASGTSRMDNVYYLSDYIYTSKFQDKASYSSLHDVNFQQNVLGDGFNIEEMVSLGYFPQLIFSSNKMPSQEFLELPSVSESDFADIVHMEVTQNNIDSAKVKVMVDNPYGEDVTEIVIANLTTKIDSQEFKDGKSTVMITVSKPTTYESKYMVSSITTTSSNGYKTTRKYKNHELFLKVEMFRKVYTVEDYMQIKTLTNQNFMIMNDLDFSGYSNYYVGTYTGVLDGGGHTFKNIRVTTTSFSGLMTYMYGTVKNLYVENFYKSSKTTYHGLFGITNNESRITNVHMKNAIIEITDTMSSDSMRIGALVGQASSSSITFCSATNVKISTFSEASGFMIGGLVGRSSGSSITNSYVQDLDIDIKNAISTAGVGGILGQEASSSVGLVDTSYAIGRIDTNSANVGGIVGNGLGYVTDSYSAVDIVSDMSFIGGINGNARASKDNVETSIYLGNLYSASVDQYIHRISSNYQSSETNYAMSTNLINGELNNETYGENLLTYNDYLKSETYDMIFDAEAFDLSKSSEGILPKLYSQDGETLLPNQKDNYLYVNMFNTTIHLVEYPEYAEVLLNMDNPDNYVVESIKVENAFVTIEKNVTENGVTQIQLQIRPDKYLDSYRISELTYRNENNELVTIDRNIRLDAKFYKQLRSYDDWQNVSTSIAENYILAADIDFTGKKNVKTRVMFNRLESSGVDENGNPISHTIKGIDLSYTANGNYHVLIQKVATSLKNVNFEDIEIHDTSSSSNNYVGIIMYNYAEMSNCTFKDIVINAPKENYVAPIAINYAYNLNNIKVDKVIVSGKTYVAGFVAYAFNTVNDRYENINGINLDVQGTGESVAGLFGRYANAINKKDDPMYLNMSVKDSKIHGTAYYVGGISGVGDCSYCYVDNVDVTGSYDIGGIVGHFKGAYQYGNLVENSHISGTVKNIGGVYGYQYHIYDMHVKNTTVEGLNANTNSVGGITGYRSGSGELYRCGVLDSNIINKGERTGGLIGTADNATYVRYSYITDSNVISYDSVGGAIGYMTQTSYLENNRISNTNVVAENYYAGGLVGYYNNDGAYGSYTEGVVREDVLENVNVQANHYAGGLFGAANADLYYAERIRKLYFSGTVKTLSGSNAGLATGDKHNIEVMDQPRIYAYDKSLVNGIEVKETAGVKEISSINLLENTVYLPGYIKSDGSTSYNENDVKAIYSDFIEIKNGKSYVLNVDYITRPNAYNVYLYDSEYVYKSAITSSTVDSYITSYHTTSNYDNIVFTAYKDCYFRIAITDKDSVNEITLKEIYRPTVVDKDKLLDASKLRESLTWVDQTSTTTQANVSLLNLNKSYWDYSELHLANRPVEVADKTANKYEASGYLAAISSDGAMFQANNKDEHYLKVNNYKFPNNKSFTVNAKFNNYSSRSYAPIITAMKSDGAMGFGIFSHALQIGILVGNRWYSTGYYIPYISDVDITVTYNNKNISLYVDGEFIKNIATVDIGDLSTYHTYIGYSHYYNNYNVAYNFVGHIRNVSVFDRVLDANEIRSNYNSSGITNTNNLHLNYDFTKEAVDHDANYMPLKENLNAIYPIKYQRIVPMPKYTDSFTEIPILLNYSLNSPLLNQYFDVYSSGIDTINVEFKEISRDLVLKYRIGDNEYKVNVDRKVYTLHYDYLSDIEIELSNSFESKVLRYKASDLAKKIKVTNKNYYHIDNDDVLYRNNGKVIDDAVHIYNNLVLLKNGKVYNLSNSNVQSMSSSVGILRNINSIRSTVLNNKVINTYYNYTVVDNEELEGQLFIKDSHAYMFNSNEALNDNIVYNLYNTEEYQIVLLRDGSLSSYKAGIKLPNSFVNKNIKEITFDEGSKDTIIMIRYDSGNVLAFNYITGEEVFVSGEEMSATLFEYLSSSLSSNTYSLTNSSEEYKESKKFVNKVNKSNESILNALDSLSNNTDNSTSNILNTEYISVYNGKTNNFDVYNVNELVTSKNDKIDNNTQIEFDPEDMEDAVDSIIVDEKNVGTKIDVKPLNSKVKSNFVLYDYFFNNNKNSFVEDKKTLIYGIIIGFVIINLFILSYVYNKKENSYEGE